MAGDSGKIFVAEHEQTLVIKLQGDLRLTLSPCLDEYISHVFDDTAIQALVVDLHHASNLDSTTLGLLAKLGLDAKEKLAVKAVMISANEDIQRLLASMGINQLFRIEKRYDLPLGDLEELIVDHADEASIKEKVLEAHRLLMSLNENNDLQFKDLVKQLECAQAKP